MTSFGENSVNNAPTWWRISKAGLMALALSTSLRTDFPDAVARTKAALAGQGFGVLTEIDMAATLKAKLGHDMENYLILGACNPSLAHQVLAVEPLIGVLLPCNVVIWQEEDHCVVAAMEPLMMSRFVQNATLENVARKVSGSLSRILETMHGA